MAFKFVVLALCFAATNAGVLAPAPLAYGGAVGYGAPGLAYPAPAATYGYAAGVPSVSSVSQNTLRSFGNTAQVSTYSKSLDTPFSSVRKTDVRVTNDAPAYGYAAAAPAYAYSAPNYAQGPVAYATPAVAKIAAPLTYAAPAYAQQYAAPIAHAAYQTPLAHATYSAPIAQAAYATPIAHAAYQTPLAHAAYAAPIAKVAHPGLLGVAYSAAPAVAHMTFQGYGINYAY